MTYSDKLRDPRWQRKRLEVFQYADFRCQVCGSSSKTLNVHHSYYEKGREPWDYPNGALISACEDCHEIIETHVKHKLPAKTVPAKPTPLKRWKGLTIPEDHLVRIAFAFPDIRSDYDWFYANLTNVNRALNELDAGSVIPSHWPREFRNIPEPRRQIDDMAIRSFKCSVNDILDRLCRDVNSKADESEWVPLLHLINDLRALKDSDEDIQTRYSKLNDLCSNSLILYRILEEKRAEESID